MTKISYTLAMKQENSNTLTNKILSVNMFSKDVRPVGLTPFAYKESQNWFFYPISGALKYSDADTQCIMQKGKLYILPYKKIFSLSDINGVRFNHMFIAFNCSDPIYDFMEFDVENDSFLKNYLQFLNNNYQKIQVSTKDAIDDIAVPLTTVLLNHLFPQKNSHETNLLAVQIKKFIDDNMPVFNFKTLYSHFNYTKRYLDLIFKNAFNLSIFKYAKNRQFSYIANMVLQNISLNDICDKLDYSSSSNLSRDFKLHYGMTPLEYKSFVNEKKPTKGSNPKRKTAPKS